jgi:Fur family peroxide stress response transcriptional regulator
MAEKLEQLEEACRDRKIPLTPQRRLVLEILAGSDDHPSADQIYESASRRFPGISRSTIYRILETFVELGVARRAYHHEAASRYDSVTTRHHHLLCIQCGRLIDWRDERFDDLDMPARLPDGFQLIDYSVYVHGLCSHCQKQ